MSSILGSNQPSVRRSPTGPLSPEERTARKRTASAASKQGWSLFNEDVRRGRFFALVGKPDQ